MQVMHIGTVAVRLRIPNGENNDIILLKNIQLYGVPHTLESTYSLIFISRLIELCRNIMFDYIGVVIISKDEVSNMETAKIVNTMFMVD